MGRPNLVCNIEKMMSNIIKKSEMIEQTKSQASKLRPMQDFQWAQWGFEDVSNMMLEKEWLCNFFEIIFKNNMLGESTL
jgi:hypothetical protein